MHEVYSCNLLINIILNMNKLKLNLAHKAGEILSREELKKILGGADSGSGSENCTKYICSEKPCCDPLASCVANGSTYVCMRRF